MNTKKIAQCIAADATCAQGTFDERVKEIAPHLRQLDKENEHLRRLLARWLNIAENGRYGEHTMYPLKGHPIVSDTRATLTAPERETDNG